MSAQTLKVLGALLSPELSELSGADIGRATQLASGTLYPILLRLEAVGWLQSRWEDDDPKSLGRPRRRFYRITALGAQRTAATLDDLGSAFRSLRPDFGRAVWA
jgi:PadR family transcriptional regulator, regulatory protein PadR